MLKKKDKPRDEFLKKASELLKWCTPIELELLRFKTGAEMQLRIDNWGRRVDESIKTKGNTVHDKRAKYRKRVDRLNECNNRHKQAAPIGNANN